jgi:dTDP-glucose 4,6-dehydratase
MNREGKSFMAETSLAGKKVLVTGAGGFIGSHLTETMVALGASVRAFVRYNSRADTGFLKQLDPLIQSEIQTISGDLRDPHAIFHAVQGCDIVFHLGALITIPYSYLHPREVIETNVMGTLNVLTACMDHNVSRLVHTSTSEVYGTARRVPIDESHPLQGQSPYSASKIGADKIAESFFCSYATPVVTIRPFNTYGPRQSARAVIPTIITQALTQDVIHLGSLDTRRDFTYVSDTVQGFICGALSENVEGQTFNLGYGSEVTIGQLAEKVISLIGRPVRIETDPQRLRPENSEVMRLLSDNQLAKQRLNWQPEVSFDEGIEKTIQWIQQNLQNFRVGIYEV